MATYYARKAGNINAADVWSTTPSGTASDFFPSFTSGDVLMANSFAITVNVSTDLGSTGQVRNDTTGGATAGGSFTLSNGVTLTANVIATTTANGVVQYSGTVGNSATIVGNVFGGGSNARGADNLSTGTLNIVGNCTGGTIASGHGAINAAAGVLNITGNCTGGTAASGAVNNAAGGILNITGNCIGGTANGAFGANNNNTGTINLTGNATGGSAAGAFGINNNSTGSIYQTGSVFASELEGGVGSANRSGLNFLTGPFYTSPTWGVNPIRCLSWRWNTSLVNTTFIEVPTSNLTAKRNLVTPDNATNFPAASNVRSGTTYGISGELVGTCAVPSPVSVASGIAVDNTVGTLATPTAEQIKDAVWSATNRTITGGTVDTLTNAPASVTPSDIWSYNARTITGGTVDTLTNAPTVPSASAIASQVRTELGTELGRIDQNISSRLAAADYTAPSAAPSVADIRTELDANSTKLANLDATISSRLADADYTAPTSAPTVADIRAELAVELGRLDASVSSRLAGSSYTAPTTPPTAAEITTAVWAAADKTGYSLTSAERSAIAAAVESSILNEGDGQAVLNAIVGAIGNTNLSEVSLVAAVRADLERTGGKLDSIPTTSAPSASTVAGAVRSELTTELSRIDQTISSRLASADYTAPTAAPTAAQNASAVRSELSVELARLDAPVSGATAPSAATVASAVRSELSSELTKVSALNTDRLANCATTQIVGTLLAQANS